MKAASQLGTSARAVQPPDGSRGQLQGKTDDNVSTSVGVGQTFSAIQFQSEAVGCQDDVTGLVCGFDINDGKPNSQAFDSCSLSTGSVRRGVCTR